MHMHSSLGTYIEIDAWLQLLHNKSQINRLKLIAYFEIFRWLCLHELIKTRPLRIQDDQKLFQKFFHLRGQRVQRCLKLAKRRAKLAISLTNWFYGTNFPSHGCLLRESYPCLNKLSNTSPVLELDHVIFWDKIIGMTLRGTQYRHNFFVSPNSPHL